MDNHEELVGIKTRYENSTETELKDYIYAFQRKWVHTNNKDPVLITKRAMENFNLKENYTYDQLHINYQKCLHNVTYLYLKISDPSSSSLEVFDDVHPIMYKIFESIDYSCKILKMCCMVINNQSEEAVEIKDDLGLLRFIKPNIDANSPLQNLLLYLLDSIYEAGLQRFHGSLYEKILWQGHFTHAWKLKKTITEFIYEKTEYAQTYQQWHNLTSNAANIRNATEHLENCHDPRMKDLIKDRNVFAFTNGIYNCKETETIDGKIVYVDHFYEYGSTDLTKQLDRDIVACKFFKMEFNNFDDTDNWYDIPTPHLHKIFEYQEFEKDVIMWIYVFIGRLMFNLGELDNWQVAMFLEGVAGSGKSTITKLVKRFYETCDVGVLSNNIEKKFGLSSLKDKLLILAPEIKGDFGLEQSEFQLLIEGGDMQLPVKFKESYYIEWKIPCLLAGNEPPDYTDNSGSISRRVVVAKFTKKVQQKDGDLDAKLLSELPFIMKKCVCAYLSAVNKFKGQDFWNSLQNYFRENQKDMAQNTHALEHFINSGKVILGEEHYCREKIFTQAFNDHCKECHLDRHKWNTDYFQGVFSNYSISLRKNVKLKYPNTVNGRMYQGTFIVGIDIISDFEEKEDDF